MLMLEFMRGKVSDRKSRLAADAFCLTAWNMQPPKGARRILQVIERYADGMATIDELATAHQAHGREHRLPGAMRITRPTGQCGDVTLAQCFELVDAELQFGHGIGAVETIGERTGQRDQLRLQFGHGIGAVETSFVPPALAILLDTSIRPRHWCRGDQAQRNCRQYGRNFNSATALVPWRR
jgi:hypothetical protein